MIGRFRSKPRVSPAALLPCPPSNTAIPGANSLYFTAGPDEEKGGLFGFLTVAPAPED